MSLEDQDSHYKVRIPRKTLFDAFLNSKFKIFDRKFDEVVDFVAIRTSCPEKFHSKLNKELRNFKSQLHKKWLHYNRHKERFLANENAWLNEYCEFSRYSAPKGEGPPLPFKECGDSSKRKKTADLRSQLDADVLAYAAHMKFRESGKIEEAKVIKKMSDSPSNSKETSDTEINKISALEVLSLIIEAQLSRKQYELVRSYAPNVFPSYKVVQKEKLRSYPPNVQVTETEAIVPLQSLLDHTGNQLLGALKDVLKSQAKDSTAKLVLHSKYGFDGSSSHTQYKQKFASETDDDKFMFLSCLVPLRLTQEKDGNTVVLWQNPKPSSPRFCRPISLHYLKETDELVRRIKKDIDNQIFNLYPTETELDGVVYKIEHRPILTMVDGKLCNTLSETKSTLRCYLCDATSKDFNYLNKILNNPVNPNYLAFGISVLHAWIRLFEALLHLAYRLPVRVWRLNKELKETVEQNKRVIQAEFKNQLSLIVDRPKPGYGNTNDGNVARIFFQNFEVSARITGIDQRLIKNFYIILQTISSGFKINTDKFKEFCLETATLYINLYSWMPMTPTVHKILIHGPLIVKEALLPIGMLSEEAQEARNKDFKSYREHFGRKTSRTDNLKDVVNRLLLPSDPLISLMRPKRTENKKSFDPEVLAMLEEEFKDQDY